MIVGSEQKSGLMGGEVINVTHEDCSRVRTEGSKEDPVNLI